MFLNSADPDVAERGLQFPQASARLDRLDAMLAALRELKGDQTLVVRSGKPVGAFRAEGEAPRVVIAPDDGDECVSGVSDWLYAGAQTGLPIACESLKAGAQRHFSGTLAGRLVAMCGLGTTGGAQPLAATFNGAALLGIDADADQIKRRVKTGYCEVMVNDLDEALRILKNSVRRREPASVGLIGNCAEIIPQLASRGIVPDLMIDCTLGDELFGSYIPRGISPTQAAELRRTDMQAYREKSLASIEAQVKSTLELQRLGSRTYRFASGQKFGGTTLPLNEASRIADFSAEFVEPLFAGGLSLLLWAALSGEPADISRADKVALELFASDLATAQFLQSAARHVQYQGLPARVCLVGRGLRSRFGLALNEAVAQGTFRAPLLVGCAGIARDKHSAPSFSSEVSGGSAGVLSEDQFAALLAGLSPEARAASWVAAANHKHSLGSHLNLAIVADGSPETARRIARMLGGERSAL